jgi:hypothetical protein
MAWSKDLLNNDGRPSRTQIDALMLAINRDLGPTHISIAVPMNTSADRINDIGSPFGIEPAIYAKQFTDSIHAL